MSQKQRFLSEKGNTVDFEITIKTCTKSKINNVLVSPRNHTTFARKLLCNLPNFENVRLSQFIRPTLYEANAKETMKRTCCTYRLVCRFWLTTLSMTHWRLPADRNSRKVEVSLLGNTYLPACCYYVTFLRFIPQQSISKANGPRKWCYATTDCVAYSVETFLT